MSTISSDTIARATALGSDIREASDEIEKLRGLPRDLVDRMIDAELFRIVVPASLGGLELDVASAARVIEAVARADGSAGWCVMIGATSGVVTGYLEKSYAKEMAGDPRAVFGGVFAPKGRAVVDGDHYVGAGRWSFASGCGHCTWLMGGCVVFDGDKPRMISDGVPDTRMLLFPASHATIHDTWDVAGLCGTGSHDMEIAGERVPAERSVALGRDKPYEDGPLYRFPVFGLLAMGIAAVALGIARRAIDEFVSLATTKVATGQRKRLADRGTIQAELACAEAELRSGRAFLYETIDRCWEDAVAGAIRPRERAVLRLAASHATTLAARAVDRVYEAGGGTSIYRSSPLQRCFRDVHVATQHMMVAAGSRELAGRILLGVQDDDPML